MKMRKTLLFLLLINVGCGSLFAMEQKAAELLDLPDELIVAQFEGVINTAGTVDEALKNLIKLGNVNRRLLGILNDARTINTLGKAFQKRFSIEVMNKALLAEVRKEAPIIAIKILLAGADVNAQDRDLTALMFATGRRNREITKELLVAGAKVDTKTNAGKTALMYIAEFGYPEIARMLIEAGADVNAQDNDGTTALIEAATLSKLAVIQALLAAGADVNAQTNDGFTALTRAASVGTLATVQALLKAGADVNARDRLGRIALDIARIRGNSDIIKILEAAGARR